MSINLIIYLTILNLIFLSVLFLEYLYAVEGLLI